MGCLLWLLWFGYLLYGRLSCALGAEHLLDAELISDRAPDGAENEVVGRLCVMAHLEFERVSDGLIVRL